MIARKRKLLLYYGTIVSGLAVAFFGYYAYSMAYKLISAKTSENIDEITQYIKPGNTIVLVGSSGIGKSTLINNHLFCYT